MPRGTRFSIACTMHPVQAMFHLSVVKEVAYKAYTQPTRSINRTAAA